MELIGLMLAVPVFAVVAAGYCLLILPAMRRKALRLALLIGSGLVIAVFATEVVLLASFGALGTYARFGGVFTAVHLLLLATVPPAVANLMLLLARRSLDGTWERVLVAAPTCLVTCLALALFNIGVWERIHGVDGLGATPPRLERSEGTP